MIRYEPARPLIFIHIPKCAGTSVRPIVRRWFGKGYYEHYQNPQTRAFPGIIDFSSRSSGDPQVIYGHFSSAIGLGLGNRYPNVAQFVTILRDPLETVVSEYYFSIKRARPVYQLSPREMAAWIWFGGFRKESRIEAAAFRKRIESYQCVENYVLQKGSQILDHFPVKITHDNYIDVIESMFVEVGVLDHLEESICRIAVALGKSEVIPAIPHLNKSKRHQGLSEEAVARFKEENALAYKVYNYVLARFNPVGDEREPV